MLKFTSCFFWWNLMPFHLWFSSDMPQTSVAKDVEAACETTSSHYGFQDLQIWCGPPLLVRACLPTSSHESLTRMKIYSICLFCCFYACLLNLMGFTIAKHNTWNINIPIVLNHGAQNCGFSFIVKHVIILIVSNSNHFHLIYLLGFYWVC
jgi:hypothetical protein